MKPTIDVSKVANDKAFVELDRLFGLSPRLNAYHSAIDKNVAINLLESVRGVLDGHESKREAIVAGGLEAAAGSVLAAVEYALRVINGDPPGFMFNSDSSQDKIVLTP
ncbi:hypothetical protein WN982_33360 [Paraburkholderia sp. IMGN_8]|uniref:hypothetical protein n=1 Tax=Paraburkholderia sp. IMGN_8 TaxID=3136564 RepID=UPI0031019ED0